MLNKQRLLSLMAIFLPGGKAVMFNNISSQCCKFLGSIFFFLCIFFTARSQENHPDPLDRYIQFPNKIFQKVDKQAGQWENQIDKQAEKYIKKLQRQELQLRKKLMKKDSAAAVRILSTGTDAYAKMLQQLNDSGVISKFDRYYSSHQDSLQTALTFIAQQKAKMPNGIRLPGQLGTATSALKNVQGKFNQADAISKLVEQRKQFLRQQIQKVGAIKAYKKYREQAYYYQKQVEEYRNLLNDPDAMGKRILAEARKLPVFQEFFSRYSELAMLFPTPANYGSPQSIAGLQSLNQVQQLVQGQIAGGGPGAQALVQQNVQQAQGMLNSLKDKFNQLGGSGGDIEMPDFKPNSQKSKTLLQRLELGSTFQTQHASYYFPTTTDIALTLGYRVSDKSIVGIGASYKMGWGRDYRHVAISSQGVGFRSFADWKIKGSFFVSGGFEYNYQQPFSSFQDVKKLDDWTKSGLIGMSKIISVKSKVFKKTKVQLLWDFLSYQQQPATNPIKFRIGYNF